MTISDRIRSIRKDSGLSQEKFAESIGIKRANLANIEVGKQLPTIEQLQVIVRKYHIAYSWLIEGVGDQKKNAHPNAHPSAHPLVEEGNEKYIKRVGMMEKVIDTSGHQLVPITDIKAAAGAGYINDQNWDETDVLRLPPKMVKGSNHLCIRIKGISMAPTLQDGGYVIVRLLDKSEWLNMPTDRIYVVVDKEGQTFLKRVKNRFSGQRGGFIVLSSDNPDKMSHPNFNLHPNEIGFIWYVEWYFTAKMPNIHDQYYTRLSRLEDTVDEITNQFMAFKKQSDLKK